MQDLPFTAQGGTGNEGRKQEQGTSEEVPAQESSSRAYQTEAIRQETHYFILLEHLNILCNSHKELLGYTYINTI